MSRKIILSVMLVLSIGLLIPKDIFAIRLLTEEKALKEMFPGADKISTETQVLDAAQIENVKKKLGGSLVYYQKGSESEESKEGTKCTFYFALKGKEKIGVAVIEEQPGKWGPVEFIIVLDTVTGKVKNLAVMSYTEKRGRPIARQSFLKQFVGKGSKDQIKAKKDIRAVSGATISSDSACFAVKKVIVLYEEVFLKKGSKKESSESEEKKK